ncbi:MAG: hypothetical protein PF518_17210 [Spirochaetaceae bacterium]|nr:hypothetical protein [Spirochaetaceae bacterium]
MVIRREGNTHHQYFHNDSGVLDIISRNDHLKNELQITVSQQNFGLLISMETDFPVVVTPVAEDPLLKTTRIGEVTEVKVTTAFRFKTGKETHIRFKRVFLESIRAIRIYQEGGDGNYLKYAEKYNEKGVSIESHGNLLELKRNYQNILNYRAILSFPEEIILEKNNHHFILPEGEYLVPVSIFLSGFFKTEDFSIYTKNPLEMLAPRLQLEYKTLTRDEQKLVNNNLSGLSILAGASKLMAGGPRFFTYFGRDTLITLSLLVGKVEKKIIINGLRSVLARLSEKGEVAHEETIGEYAHLLYAGDSKIIPDSHMEYQMVDDDFLLPLTVSRCLELGFKKDLAELLESRFANGESGYELLVKNIKFCSNQLAGGLIPYHRDVPVGDWRDSLAFQGIHYSYELNRGLAPYLKDVILTLKEDFPACSESMADYERDYSKFQMGLSQYYVSERIEDIHVYLNDWLSKTGFSFNERNILMSRVNIKEEKQYPFFTMALDKAFEPIKIQHNDMAFSMLYGFPEIEELDIMLIPLETFFPLGLKTGVGILVSNPCFAKDLRVRFDLN